MARYYTDDDVARWEKAYENSINLHLAKLSTDLTPDAIDHHLGMLTLGYQTQAKILIARNRFAEAIDWLRKGIEARCMMYERFERGEGRALEAGYYQDILVALVTRDEELISRLVRHYRADSGTPDSVFLGRAVKCLANGDLVGAKEALGRKQPRFEGQFKGYAECLEAIADKDPCRFAEAFEIATKSWTRFAARTVRGLPLAVCFIQGVGLIRLAERVIGERIEISNEHIPSQLLQ